MPIIRQLPFDPLTVDLSPERNAKRSPGIHLSTIIKDMLITSGINRAPKSNGPPSPNAPLIFEKGFLWERIIEHALKGQMEVDIENSSGALIRPGELFMDGIFMTPDAINLNDFCVEEWKATGIRSTNFDIESRRIEWLWQAAAYARFYGFNKARFRVWHHMEMPPVVSSFEIEWTDQEIEENWARIRDHYEYMKRRDASPKN